MNGYYGFLGCGLGEPVPLQSFPDGSVLYQDSATGATFLAPAMQPPATNPISGKDVLSLIGNVFGAAATAAPSIAAGVTGRAAPAYGAPAQAAAPSSGSGLLIGALVVGGAAALYFATRKKR